METYDLILRNGRIVNSDAQFSADLAILGHKIVRMEESMPMEVRAIREIDASGLHILPGLLDTHVHLNQPGRTEWEGLASGSASLAAGGVTTFFDMPLNSHPPTTTVAGFALKKQAADLDALINYRLWGGLVPDNLDQLSALHEKGVVGFKAFMSGSGIEDFEQAGDTQLLLGMQKIAGLNSILALHAENESMTKMLSEQAIAQGRVSVRDYCAARPIVSEVEAVSRAISYAEVTGCALHILHVSNAQVVGIVAQAKERGVDITVETCPHYLSLTVADFERLGAIAKCAPPVRDEAEVARLWDVVSKGYVDFISSDHSPATPALKVAPDGNIFQAWGGISGAQTTLNVLMTEGYHKGRLSLEAVVRLTSTAAARRFKLFPQKGVVAVGSDADLVLLDVDASFSLEKDDLFYRHKHSPYIGRSFQGQVISTICQGNLVYDRGCIVS